MSDLNKNTLYSDVVICGGALAGMTLALAFIKNGFNVVMVDPKTVKDLINFDKRTTAIAEGAKNFYDTIGVWKKVKRFAEPIKIIKIKDGSSKIDLNFDCKQFEDNTNVDSLGYVLENVHLLKQINSTIEGYRNKEGLIKRIKARVVSIDSNNLNSKVILSNKMEISSSLVVACDGKHSIARNMMNIGTKSYSYKQEAFVCTILHEKRHDNIALEKFLPGGPLAILPMKKYKNMYRSSVIWSDGREASKSRYNSSMNNTSNIESEIEDHCKDWLGKVKVDNFKALFPLELTMPKSMIENRFILIGDSAHSIHPIAGQGFNLTIRDIKSFVEECHKRKSLGLDIGSKIFLKNFERKRTLDINSLVRSTHILNKLFENNGLSVKFFRRLGLSAVSRSKIIKKIFMKYAMGI